MKGVKFHDDIFLVMRAMVNGANYLWMNFEEDLHSKESMAIWGFETLKLL